jgi:hypothetical protein
MITCTNCGFDGTEIFCARCGQHLKHERIKFSSLVHEVVHTFTHFENKFLFAFKQLAIRPGFMQKNYLAGHRTKPQKPFSMFVVCATICSLSMYFIYKYFNSKESDFYHHYWVFIHALFLPFFAVTTWIFFRSSKLYYAESLVLTIYMLGFMLLLIIPINILAFFFNKGVVSICEVILLTSYNVWTNLNFFSNKPKWLVIIKSMIALVLNYWLLNVVSSMLL